ncbi:MAG TPA: tripartite tricarboxylate transporter TctB family protein [Myxococcota bacterium]|nr:tripartite tricarboxylate transporter TctB family protein [Myxococcota bacterium]
MSAGSRRAARIRRAAVSGALAAAGLALYAHTYHEKYHTGFAASDPNAMILPRALLALLVALGALAAWRDLRVPDALPPPAPRMATLLLPAALLAGSALVAYVGFLLAVAPLIAVALYALGERRWGAILATTAVVGVGFWYLFHHVLLIRLPSVMSGGAF